MTKLKTILFLSYYGHQKRFFSNLAIHIPKHIRAFSLNIYQLSLFPRFIIRFIFNLIFGAFHYDENTINPIIEFSYKRFKARHPKFPNKILVIIKAFQIIRAKTYYQFFRTWLGKQEVDLLVVWNGLRLPVAAAVSAAKDNGIKLLFCENGYLPKTVTMDTKGVNAFNSLIGKTAEFYQKVPVEEGKLEDLFKTTLIPRQLNQKNISAKYRRKCIEEEIKLPQEFIFLPLQVHDDSQILIHSPNFQDMYSLVNFCASEIRTYNKKYQSNLKLVIKEHPSDYGRIDYEPLKKQYSETIFTQIADTKELIQKCKVVITVNSTVGIEGLLYLKPVITMGNAFYNVPGLVYHCEVADDFCKLLFSALNKPIDQKLIKQFLYYLRYDYLLEIDRKNLATANYEKVVARIINSL